ncbi:AzlD domain-containing protein [Simiduia aestuariiviva]|uniref:Branched-subunit amino acid transport protein n=1 Tax=Simiduia aestuariiviva TaxID=1510459 RepID=A0A839US84_9GAMM|nr:AzlD domain-containing protein [Simiduia aestuariiviva]MBB3169319.1 branched-subunit amino acid transport protein [Simiduia aestuariiviva]
MQIDTTTLWIVIVSLGLGTYLIRFSFLGIVGDREIPEWVQRHLRYVAVAVLPALITPLVIWPPATGGEPDPARLVAALVAFAVGVRFSSVIGAVVAGMSTLYLMQYLLP